MVRDWDVACGLGDDVRCSRCGATWSGCEHLALDQGWRLREMPDTDPDLLVTLDQARRLVPAVKRNTINQVLKRDRTREPADRRLPAQAVNGAGDELYRLGDVRALARDRPPS